MRLLNQRKKAQFFVSQRIALVIGNSNYNVRQKIGASRGLRVSTSDYQPSSTIANIIAPLKNPINDAKSVIKLLRKKNFKVIKGVDVSKKDLGKLVEKFQTLLSTGGVGLFYYAGHAVNVDGNDYILPITAKDVSTERRFIAEAVNVTEILKPVEKLIEEHPVNTGSIVVYSASRGKPAFDGIGQNSPFTNAFVSVLCVRGPLNYNFQASRSRLLVFR
jgi:hypothetical protein